MPESSSSKVSAVRGSLRLGPALLNATAKATCQCDVLLLGDYRKESKRFCNADDKSPPLRQAIDVREVSSGANA